MGELKGSLRDVSPWGQMLFEWGLVLLWSQEELAAFRDAQNTWGPVYTVLYDGRRRHSEQGIPEWFHVSTPAGRGLLVDLRDSILMRWRWILGLDFAKAKKDSLQISVYLSGFRGIASVFPCLRLSLAGGQEKQSVMSWKLKSILYGSFKKYLVIQQDISCVSTSKISLGFGGTKTFHGCQSYLNWITLWKLQRGFLEFASNFWCRPSFYYLRWDRYDNLLISFLFKRTCYIFQNTSQSVLTVGNILLSWQKMFLLVLLPLKWW